MRKVLSTTKRGVAFVGELAHGGDVGETHGGIGGRLDVKHFGVGTHRTQHDGGVGGVDKTEFETEVHEELRGEAVHAAIDCFGKHDVVTGAQQAEHGVDCRHARSEDVGGMATFQFCNGALQSFAIGMIGAGVIVSAFGLAQFLVNVGGSLVDRSDHGACGGIGFLSNVNGVRRKSHVVSLRDAEHTLSASSFSARRIVPGGVSN